MEVDTWSEDWGLPSVDPECLKILAYSKFCGAPVTQKQTNNPFWSPSGTLPVFHHNHTTLTQFQAVVKHLAICNYSADFNLTQKQRSETDAFINLIKEKLSPAIQYILWIDTKNHIEFTRTWYAKHLPFPMGYYYPGRYHQKAERLIESLYSQHAEFEEIGNDTQVETSVYKAAQECLTLLDNRLGDSPYMFGRSPCRLDAVMYGYLAPLLKAPLPNCTLQNYMKNCSNLVRFVVKISQNYFPQTVKAWDDKNLNDEEIRNKKKNESKKKKESSRGGDTEENMWPHETRNKILAGAVASTAMLGYAYSSGLIDVVRNIEIKIVSENDDDYYDDDELEEEEED